jgi:hypothetical protein
MARECAGQNKMARLRNPRQGNLAVIDLFSGISPQGWASFDAAKSPRGKPAKMRQEADAPFVDLRTQALTASKNQTDME